MKKVYVIIPAYNEERHISEVISHAKKYCKNIIVVDDGSSDRTSQKAKEMKAEVVRLSKNKGKGAALRAGADRALKDGAEILVFIDADRQHDPHEIPVFLRKLENMDIVFGSRRRTKHMPLVYRIGNFVLTHLAKVLYGVGIHDTQSGYRAMSADSYKKIRWKSNDYSAESEMIANVGKHKLKYAETFIQTVYHDTKKGTTVMHGLKIGLDMLWWKVRR
jgi:glycosyltransferase involved in cell wall biosynthesis